MPRQPRVVIVGAGLTGCALADELSERGWTNVTVLEQGVLPTGGSPVRREPVFTAGSDRTGAGFATYTAEKYAQLPEPCWQAIGSLEIALTPARMRQLEHEHGWTRSWGLPSRLLDPAECARTHPLLDPHELTGGLHRPGDGLLDPPRAAEAQARRAGQRGVRFLEQHTVTGIGHHANRVRTVRTEHGDFRAEVVVLCTGRDSGRLAATVGLDLPATALSHQYGETSRVAELGTHDTWPLLRHRDAAIDIQQHADRLGIDSYTARPTPAPGARFRTEEFDPAWKACLRLMPALAEAKIESGQAGQLVTTPDGNPLLGEHPDIDGLWFAAAAADAQSAGIARALAQWLVDGQPAAAVHAYELHRFDRAQCAPAYVAARAAAWLDGLRAPGPHHPALQPRPPRTSPFHERQTALGTRFTETAGWAVPLYYEANAELPEAHVAGSADASLAPGAQAAVCAETRIARTRAAMFDLSALHRLDVTGPEAWNFLQTLTTNQLNPEPSSVTETLLLTEDGGVRARLLAACLGENHFQLSCENHADVVWLRRQLPPGGKVAMHDITAGTCSLAVCGPRATDVLAESASWNVRGDEDAGAALRGYLGTVPVRAQRSRYAGETGWELWTSADLGRQLWDTLHDAGSRHGMVAAGHGALASLRIEVGRRHYGQDVTTEHDPYEAGLGRAVRMDKGYFFGREGLIERLAAPATRNLVRLRLDPGAPLPQGGEPVCPAGEPAGEVVGSVTSSTPGYSTGTPVTYAWIAADYADVDTRLRIDRVGTMLPAVVAAEPWPSAAH